MTKRFHIKHGLFLTSANKLLTPNTHYATDNVDEQKELLEVFGEAVEEIVSKPVEKLEKKTEEKTVDPTDDITLAKGVGKGLTAKLAEKGLTTFSGLKAAMTDKAREEEMKELLGTAYPKVMKNFVTPEA
jgi:predicted flap endonuclease-1-like 5' DNA nuclease